MMTNFHICFLDDQCRMTFQRGLQHASTGDSRPRHVVTGDLNNDHHLDLVVAYSGVDSIGIFFGYGSTSFADPITYSTGLASHPLALALGHFNNDTYLDIAVANFGTHSIAILLAQANGTFPSSPTLVLLGPSRPVTVAVGHFNDDTHLDLVVANYGTAKVMIVSGAGDGWFEMESVYEMGYDAVPRSILVDDLNKDGEDDILIVNGGIDNLVILLSNGKGRFVEKTVWIGYGSDPSSVAVGDFNSDNRKDIVIGNAGTDNISIFFGSENGSVGEMITRPMGSAIRPKLVATTDFDGDGKLDLIVIDTKNNNIFALKGIGDGSFSTVRSRATGYSSDAASLLVSDFNNDRQIEIVIVNNGTNDILVVTLSSTYLASSEVLYSTGNDSFPSHMAIGDFNHDRRLDIVVANTGIRTVDVFIGLENGTLDNNLRYSIDLDSYPRSVAVAHLNEDDHLDLVIVGQMMSTIYIMLGDGNGTFHTGWTYTMEAGSSPDRVSVGDWNRDKRLDLVVLDSNASTVGVLLGYGNGTFASIQHYSTGNGSGPCSLAIGDLNGDSLSDIVTANFDGGSVSILLGFVNGSFAIPIFLPIVNCFPSAVAIEDVNSDHRLDIILVNPSYNNIGVLLGHGNGAFDPIILYHTGAASNPWSLSVADFNRDEILDVAVTNRNAFAVSVFLGQGNGSFDKYYAFSTEDQSFPWDIITGDFNSDNQTDIVVSNYGTGSIGLFLLYSITEFVGATTYYTGSGSHPYSVAIADTNNDTRPDVVVANSGNDNAETLLRDANGHFASHLVYSTGNGSNPQSIVVADFNQDGQADLAVATTWGHRVNIFFGSSQEHATVSTGAGSFPKSLAVADFNHDGRLDLVVANRGTNTVGILLGFNCASFASHHIYLNEIFSKAKHVVVNDFNDDSRWDLAVLDEENHTIRILLGLGDGWFVREMNYRTGPYPVAVTFGDFNSDQRVDIAVANSGEGSISVLLGSGNGTFTPSISYATWGSSSWSIGLGDFNNDHLLDLAVANDGGVTVILGDGKGSFDNPHLFVMPMRSISPSSIAIHDFNQDGHLDIVIPNDEQHLISLLFGNGNGTFFNVTSYSTGNGSGPCCIAIGDLNDDGRMDIVVANRGAGNLVIFFDEKKGAFKLGNTLAMHAESHLTSVALGDLNNDTFLDIVVSDVGVDERQIGILYGYGDGNFSQLHSHLTSMNTKPSSIIITDLNRDGRSDLVVANMGRGRVLIMLQNETQPFAPQITYPTGNQSRPVAAAVGDFNQDTHPDIAVVNTGTNSIGVFLGHGNGSFAAQRSYFVGSGSRPSAIVVGDINHDHRLDLLVTNAGTDSIGVFLCYKNGTFAAVKTCSTGLGSAPTSIALADLNGDRRADVIVTNGGINTVLILDILDNGTCSQSSSVSLAYNSRPQSIAIGDLNQDGWLDMAVANYGTNYVDILLQICSPLAH